jgi:hypothetical protein
VNIGVECVAHLTGRAVKRDQRLAVADLQVGEALRAKPAFQRL